MKRNGTRIATTISTRVGRGRRGSPGTSTESVFGWMGIGSQNDKISNYLAAYLPTLSIHKGRDRGMCRRRLLFFFSFFLFLLRFLPILSPSLRLSLHPPLDFLPL